jgi:hypothetical protein
MDDKSDEVTTPTRFTTPSWRTRLSWVLVVVVLLSAIVGLFFAGHTPLACLVAVMLLVVLAAGPGRLRGDRVRRR